MLKKIIRSVCPYDCPDTCGIFELKGNPSIINRQIALSPISTCASSPSPCGKHWNNGCLAAAWAPFKGNCWRSYERFGPSMFSYRQKTNSFDHGLSQLSHRS